MKREAVAYMVGHHRISVRRACSLVKLRRSVHYYRSVKDPKLALRKPDVHARWRDVAPDLHPLFRRVPGGIAGWERA